MKQLSLVPLTNSIGKVFAPKRGKRKSKRPLSTKHPIHLILNSQANDLRKNERQVLRQWYRFANLFGVKTYRLTVNSNHIHAIIRLHRLESYTKFIQALTGTLARTLKIIWKQRPVTRLVSWGRDFKRLCQYVKLNWLEANGFLFYQRDRTRRLPEFVHL